MSYTKLASIIEQLKEHSNDDSFNYLPLLESWRELYAGYDDMIACVDAISSLDDLRFLARYNLYFLLTGLIGKKHMISKWANARCKDCCNEPNGQIQLWSREHYKSSIWKHPQKSLKL